MPFGRGAFYEEKQEALKHFFSVSDLLSPYVQRYLHCHADLNHAACDSVSDKTALFNNTINLVSFNNKGPVPKASRWYAWWGSHDFHPPDVYGLKMVFESYLDLTPAMDFDFSTFNAARSPEAEIRALKAQGGGLRLAYKLITPHLDFHARGLYIAGKASWHAHSQKAIHIKSPMGALKNFVKMAEGDWNGEIVQIVETALRSPTNLKFLHLSKPGHLYHEPLPGFTARYVRLTLTLMAERGWSLKLEAHTPPARYANVLHANPINQGRAKDRMVNEWGIVLGEA